MSVLKNDPHPAVLTDPNGQTIEVVTSAPSAGQNGLVVYPVTSSAVQPTQDAATGPTNATAPADAIEIGGIDGAGKLQPLQVDTNKQLKTSNVGVSLNSYGQVSITNSATVVKAAVTSRAALLVTNAGTATIYLGDASVTTSTGFPLAAGATIGVPQTSALYGIVATGTQTLGYMEFV